MKRINVITAWLSAAFCVLGALVRFLLWLPHLTGPASLFDWVQALGWGLALPIVFALLAALIIARQPGNRVGWLMMLPALATAFPPEAIIETLSSPPTSLTLGLWLLLWLDNWSWILIIFPIFLIPLYFPTGRPPSPRWNWVNRLALGMWLFFILLVPFFNNIGPMSDGWTLPNPIGFVPEEVAQGPILIVWGLGLVTIVTASVSSLFVRFRRAQLAERQQIKWLLYAGALFVVVYTLVYVLSDPEQFGASSGWIDLVFVLSILAIPASIAIAILRHRLWDIDVIIRKTLVYSAVTSLLGLVYFGSVVLLQRLFGAVTGVEGSPLAVVVSTLAIAALFTPLRRRVQDVIDRRFFRKKYDAQRVLAQFALTARDGTDLDALTGELVRVVQDTMQPEAVSVWLKTEAGN